MHRERGPPAPIGVNDSGGPGRQVFIEVSAASNPEPVLALSSLSYSRKRFATVRASREGT